MAERQFGPYRLVRQIAVGGMAEIHLAKTKGIAGFEKYVALKMIHPNFAEDEQFIGMLVDEAKIAVQLNHANIAQTFDLGRVGETFYITMEYVDGADLYKILRRGSEMDFELPLDVCAFIAKEIASALDHAHRKRDHTGKTLGIVHRDVSPQNVLISYSGEVKLVDFGIAKATMKARQTAVGVIKGKYYYMSPEQAWGDQIDHRSDIFSAGIVLYEMLTGQMLYLEEDLHKLLDMARQADIAPPSTLRKGIPPQLERIVMHALERDRNNRYQNAQDFATDLERFLHTYSPVFTATKVSQVIKQVIGDPQEVPYGDVEVRDGPMSTHTLTADDLILDKEEIRDDNSVIFRVADLKPKQEAQRRPTGTPEGRITRQAELSDVRPLPASPPRKAPTPAAGSPAAMRQPQPTPRNTPAKPRAANEETRQVANPAPPSVTTEDSGLLELKTPPPPAGPAWKKRDPDTTIPGGGPDLEGIGESTMITGAPGGFGGFMMDAEDSVDATVVSAGPPTPDEEEHDEDGETLMGGRPAARPDTDDDGATVQRDFRDAAKPKVAAKRGPSPPALAASIHAPAVSEIRKPRASRKTPQGGVPAATQQPNVLQAIVGAKASEPMPVPRPPPPQRAESPPPRAESPAPERSEDSGAQTIPQQPSPVAGLAMPGSQPPPYGQPPQQQPYNGYASDASGLPMTPPQGVPSQQPYGQYPQPYPGYPPQGYPPQGYPQYPGYPQQGYQPPPLTPGGLYQLQPHGAPPPQPMTLTGQLRLFEADEIPDRYKVSGGPKWIKLVIAGVIAVSVAAGVTFFIIKATRDQPPEVGSIRVESVPPGAEVTFDDTRLSGATPMTIDSVPIGTRHEIKVDLARHKTHTETIDVPKNGGEVAVRAFLTPMTGKLRVLTQPDGAEIRIDGQLRGVAPKTIEDIDMSSAKSVELRLKDYQPYVQQLQWPANGEININQKLQH
ncbi:MAG TPA: protein kinase [Kofleriaceae bacterium]